MGNMLDADGARCVMLRRFAVGVDVLIGRVVQGVLMCCVGQGAFSVEFTCGGDPGRPVPVATHRILHLRPCRFPSSRSRGRCDRRGL